MKLKHELLLFADYVSHQVCADLLIVSKSSTRECNEDRSEKERKLEEQRRSCT